MAEEKTGVARWNEDAGVGRHKKSEGDRRRRQAVLALLAVLCVACAVLSWPVGAKVTRGLYLKGGTEVTLAAEGDVSADDLKTSANVIARRMSAAGVSDGEARVEGDDHVVVGVPWNVDAKELVGLISGRGTVEFVRYDEIGDADALAKLGAGGKNVSLAEGTYEAFLDGSHIKSASVTEVSKGSYAVTFVFDAEGGKVFADVTGELAEDGDAMAIVAGGRIVSAASVSQAIDGGQVSISGDFDALEANALAAVAKGASVPATLVEEGSEEVGPLVGKAGLMAIVGVALAGIVGASAYAYVRYRKLVLLTCGGLIVYALVMLGLMATFSAAGMFVLTVPGVVSGFAVALLVGLATMRLTERFVASVRGGGSVRGAALSCVGEGLRPLGAPVAVASLVAVVALFLPALVAREVALVAIFGVVSGLVAVFWYAVTLLRLLASGPIAADPAAWGLAAGDDRGEEAEN